jgi:hypothetical protein
MGRRSVFPSVPRYPDVFRRYRYFGLAYDGSFKAVASVGDLPVEDRKSIKLEEGPRLTYIGYMNSQAKCC